MSALIKALKSNDIGTALKLLTDDAVRATAADNDNEALRWAAREGHLPIVQELLKIETVRKSAAAKDNDALRWAAGNKHRKVVLELLKVEAVRNNAAANDNYALHISAIFEHWEIVEELLKIEVVRNNAAVKDNEILYVVAKNGRWQVVQELLKIEAVRNNAAAKDNEAFREAAKGRHSEVIRELLKIEVVHKHAADKDNEALRNAAHESLWQVVQELLKIEAVRNNAAAQGNYVLRLAICYGPLEVVQDLMKIEAVRKTDAAERINYSLHLAAVYHKWKVVQELLKVEHVRNNATADNNEALRCAAKDGELAIVQQLLKIEAVRNHAADKDNAALLWAVDEGRLEVIQELLQLPIVIKNITIQNHAILRKAAKHLFRRYEQPDRFSILYYLIEIYKKEKISLPKDIMIYFEGSHRNILSIDFEKAVEKTTEEAATVFQKKDHWSNQLSKLLFEYVGLPFKVKSWHELKVQEAEALLQQFNDNIKQAEGYYKEVLELKNGQHFPSGLIYDSKIVLIQNIIQKINELKTDFQKELKLMREMPESNNAAWNSFAEQLKTQRMQFDIYQKQIVDQITGLMEVQIQTLVNKLQALSRVEKTPEQTEAVKAALQKIEKVLADKKVNDFKELHERLKATSAIFEPVKNLVTALLRGKEALWLPKTRVLEINQLYQEALRVFKQDALQNNHNEALRQELNLAKAALENIRRAEVRVEKEAQDNLNGAQQTLAEAYQEFHALTEIMQKVKHLARSFKPQVKEEPKTADEPQVIHESHTLVWTDIKPTTPEMSALITDLKIMRDLLQKSKTEKSDPKEEIEVLMIKIKSQIEAFSITGSTLVEPKKPLSEVLYEWFSGNEGLYNRLSQLFNDNSSNYKLKG